MKKIGFLINPIAGMGGKVALKGTDGKNIVIEAIRRGAKPIADKKAKEFFEGIVKSSYTSNLEFLIPKGVMGENAIRKDPRTFKMLNFQIMEHISIPETTDSMDTKRIVEEFLQMDVALIIFVGGDGTAQDIHSVVNSECPILGIPSGVKIHSSVFAQSVEKSIDVTKKFAQGEVEFREAEVIDLDETAFRKGILNTRLYGICMVPHEPTLMQPTKTHTKITDNEENNIQGISEYLKEEIHHEVLYILGSGSTIKRISNAFSLEVQKSKTLLGIDAVLNGKLIRVDMTESDILSLLREFSEYRVYLILTPIGGQGFILGRGNQQLSPEVIEKIGLKSLMIIATRSKINNLPNKLLHVDTGNSELDRKLMGYQKVLVDYNEYWMLRIN
jgi:predicted polyphosphate/ATP-dependent NAD kinase